MKQGGCYAKKSAGFTIVETMIVLAVSASLFFIAAIFVGGKQAKTEFQVGVRNIQTELQQIINETASGYYGLQNTSSCTATGLPGSDLTFSPGTNNLGASGDCIFIGKAIVIDGNKLYAYPIAGARQVSGFDTDNPVTARATAVPSPDTFTLPNGMTLVSSSYTATLATGVTRGFAVLSSMANGADSLSGSQTFDLYRLGGSFNAGATTDDFRSVINGEKGRPIADAYQQQSALRLCVKSGGTNQSALITIGGSSGLAIKTEIRGGTSC